MGRVSWLWLAAALVSGEAMAAVPAAAQVNFSGEWSGRYHEDQPDRVPGVQRALIKCPRRSRFHAS